MTEKRGVFFKEKTERHRVKYGVRSPQVYLGSTVHRGVLIG
jgi:hypothetical protein